MNWKGILREACEKAAISVGSLGERGKEYVATSPSGDRTLLADSISEKAIMDVLSSASDISFVSEESGKVGNYKTRYTALIDPIDGSSNYRRGIPFYCMAVAIFDNERGEVEAAAVLDPVRYIFYFADRNGNATKNDRTIKPSTKHEVERSVIGIDINRIGTECIRGLSRLLISVGRMVHLGANALELCYVADGTIDGFVDVRKMLRPTDIAASCFIVERAGGIVSDESGKSLNIPLSAVERLSVVASCTKPLHKKVISLLRNSEPLQAFQGDR